MGQFAVLGLGRFGSAAAHELIRLGHSVLGVDADPKLVNHYADELTRAVIADATDKQALEELGLDNMDTVLVAMGGELQANLLCVVHLKELGISPLWVKASSHAHHLILRKLGVERIIHPEEEMGLRVAQALSYPMVEDYISLGNGDFIVEIHVAERLQGESLQQLLQNSATPVHVVALKRRAELIVAPTEDITLQSKDALVLLSQLQTLKAIAPKLV